MMFHHNKNLIWYAGGKINLKQGAKEEKKTEKLFESLMGKKAESRFKFIQENANFTSNLDI